MSNALLTDPSSYEMSSVETLPLAINVAPVLELGDTPSNPTATLVDLSSGGDYTVGLDGSPTVFSSNISIVTVTDLLPEHKYRLTLEFDVAAGKHRSVSLHIICPF